MVAEMTDTPFTETLRSFSKLCGGGNEDVAAAIDAALAEIDRLTAPCRWTRDQSFIDESDKWDTACDRAFTFIDGGPRENNYAHCPGCGRVIEVTTAA
jgi:hypothetical protein